MTDYAGLIEKSLSECLAKESLLPFLKETVEYSLMNGGKRIRPYLCLLVTDMLGGSVDAALPYACAVEMIHTYSLIHDDLPAMDNDDMRRGKPSNHIMFGEGNAVLAGDTLLSMAANLLAHEPNLLANSAVMSGAIEMLNGQSLDINPIKRDDANLVSLYDGKTGGLFCSAILSGFYASGGKIQEAKKWKRFALDFGRLFQITDDLLDKAKDTEENKFTYLSLHTGEETQSYVRSLVSSLISFLQPYENEPAQVLRNIILSLPTRTK